MIRKWGALKTLICGHSLCPLYHGGRWPRDSFDSYCRFSFMFSASSLAGLQVQQLDPRDTGIQLMSHNGKPGHVTSMLWPVPLVVMVY